MTPSAPILPPLLTGHAGDPARVPFAEARCGAAEGRFAAGDLVWRAEPGRVSLALVLEPDVAARRAREMQFVATVAAGDAVGALVPPEVAITWDWPATLRANDAVVGGIGLCLSRDSDAAGAPNWLVLGLDLALGGDPGSGRCEPGRDPDRTSLFDEGGGSIDAAVLIEAFARHLLAWIDTWRHDGFAPVRRAWLFRARDKAVMLERDGLRLRGRPVGLDDHGGLMLEGEDGIRVVEPRDIEPCADAGFGKG